MLSSAILPVIAAGIAFALFGWAFADALHDGMNIRSSEAGEEASRNAAEIFMFIPPPKLARLGRILAVAAFMFFFIPLFSLESAASCAAGVVLGLAAAFWAFKLPGKVVAILKERRRLKFVSQLPETLATMSNALRAGFSLNQAFESVAQTLDAPVSQEFGVLLRQMRVGMGFEECLHSMDKRMASEDLTLIVTAIEIARKTGGNLTEIFDRISMTIRGRQRIESRVRALTAQGRMQGIVVSLMPLLLGLILTAMKPGMMLPFFTSTAGMVSVGAMIALEIAGWILIKKIITIDV